MSILTGAQIRMARSALGWSAEALAERCGIASKTVRRIEAVDGIPHTTAKTLASLQKTLESAGIEFIGSPEDAPGIRIHNPPG